MDLFANVTAPSGRDCLTDIYTITTSVCALDVQGIVSEINHTTVIACCAVKWSIQVMVQQSMQELGQETQKLMEYVCKAGQNVLHPKK